MCFPLIGERPVLLLVNQKSGQYQAEKIVSEFAGPLLYFFGCAYEVVKTGSSKFVLLEHKYKNPLSFGFLIS